MTKKSMSLDFRAGLENPPEAATRSRSNSCAPFGRRSICRLAIPTLESQRYSRCGGAALARPSPLRALVVLSRRTSRRRWHDQDWRLCQTGAAWHAQNKTDRSATAPPVEWIGVRADRFSAQAGLRLWTWRRTDGSVGRLRRLSARSAMRARDSSGWRAAWTRTVGPATADPDFDRRCFSWVGHGCALRPLAQWAHQEVS